MKTSDFDFNLPEELIAQTPILNRSESKLLVLDKETGEITHERFYNIVNYLNENYDLNNEHLNNIFEREYCK